MSETTRLAQEEHFEEEGTDRMDPSTDSGGNGLFQLPGAQQQLVDAVVATKTPVVQVLINGGPLSLEPPSKAANFAMLEAFYGAQVGETLCPLVKVFTPVSSPTLLRMTDACFWTCHSHAEKALQMSFSEPRHPLERCR